MGWSSLESVGSSPLARGLRRGYQSHPLGARIIPARAGFTSLPRFPYPRAGDHPRSRGVYWIGGGRGGKEKGSSPLARGLHEDNPLCTQPYRIIPARAGFTFMMSVLSVRVPDHPRSRGVYLEMWGARPAICGSSPLARGLRMPPRPPGGPGRIIPARAGFTYQWVEDSTLGSDHPRSRGVYVPGNMSGSIPDGSSPLARGLLGDVDAEQRPRRIIPARAGFTEIATHTCT